MFKRRQHDIEPAAKMVSPTEGRPLRYRYPEKRDNAERQSRVETEYVAEGVDGRDRNVVELIHGWTELRGEPVTTGQIRTAMSAGVEWVMNRTSLIAAVSSAYLIEYPRARTEDPTDARLFVTGSDGGLIGYTLKEVNDQVLVLGRERNVSEEATYERPKGARVTVSARGSVPANGREVVEKERTFEETFFEELRGAISDYESYHPD